MNESMNTQLKRGTLDVILLSLIGEHGCTYGYSILDKMSELGGEFFENPKPGTVYPVLYRLEKEGYIEVTGSDRQGGPTRKIYQVTDKGREKLKNDVDNLIEYQKVMATILGDHYVQRIIQKRN